MTETAAQREQRRLQETVQRFTFDMFDPAAEEVQYYIERFENKLRISGLGIPADPTTDTNERKDYRRDLFLACIGREPYKLLCDRFRPDNVSTKQYTQLKDEFLQFYKRKVFMLAERREFLKRQRKEGESIQVFLTELRRLARDCSFGNTLDERLRDQLVVGINESHWQTELIRQFPGNNHTMAEVLAAAELLETASQQQKRLTQLSSNEYSSTVRHVKKTQGEQNQIASRKQTNFTQNAKRTPFRLDKSKHCMLCGKNRHQTGEKCLAKGVVCAACNIKGHFARCCIKSGRAVDATASCRAICAMGQENEDDLDEIAQLNMISDNESEEVGCEIEDDYYGASLNTVNSIRRIGQQAIVNAMINNKQIKMVYDPGAMFTVISESIWQKIGKPQLRPVPKLEAYTHVEIETLGVTEVVVQAFSQKHKLQVTVIKHEDVPLFGFDWCTAFKLPMPTGVQIRHVANKPETDVQPDWKANSIVNEYSDVFSSEPGTIKGHVAHVHIAPNATPRAFPARPVPFPLRRAVEDELQRLTQRGIIEPVDPSTTPIEWASPIVTVIKSNGTVRICGDFKVTINQFIQSDSYPLPRFEELIAKLNGCKVFSIIDLKDAYLQIPVAEDSRKYLTIITHKGYFRYTRLPFGVNFAAPLFQSTMDKTLAGLEHTGAFIDDIIVGSENIQRHDIDLRAVLNRLRMSGFRTEPAKCKFFQPKIQFMGHVIDATGLHPSDDKLTAMRDMRQPSNVSELRSFLGTVNFYAKFIPNLQPRCACLHELTKKAVPWFWSEQCDKAFNDLKAALTSSDTLMHYDPNLPLILMTDASEVGIGAVLAHRIPGGTEMPVAFASRILQDNEKKYAVIEREALSIIYGVTKFQQFLLGRRFILRTDHKPLQTLLGSKTALPKVAANRLNRWSIILSAYNYEIEYIAGSSNRTADVLSRLPSHDRISDNEKASSLLHLRLKDLPVSAKELKAQSLADPTLMKVRECIDRGWPTKDSITDDELFTYYEKRDELAIESGIILWRGRMVIPSKLRQAVMSMLHDGHPGVVAMRELARFSVWWPQIDIAVENYVKSCQSCQAARSQEPLVPLFAWNVPEEPWSRIHIDYAGPFRNKMWLVIVDAFTKWIEVIPMSTTTSEATARALRQVFAHFGFPRSLVSDNGPQFTSEEFAHFMKSNNITHMKSTPYHARTNGLAERAVRTFKDRIKAAGESCDVDLELQRFLFSYRNTPTKATGRSPAEVMFGRHLRTPLDLLKPDIRTNLSNAATREKLNHDAHTKERHFGVHELVWCWDARVNSHIPAIIKKRIGVWSYIVSINGREHRRHADQLRKRYLTEKPPDNEFQSNDDFEQNTIFPEVREPQYSNAAIAMQPQTTECAEPQSITQTQPQLTATTLTKDVATEKVNTRRSERGCIPRRPLPYDKYLENPTVK
jgi:transposase InsO family protein